MSDDFLKLLREAELSRFYVRLRDELHITRLEHFDHVEPEDLQKIGIDDQSVKTLLKLARKHRIAKKQLSLINKLTLLSVRTSTNCKSHQKSLQGVSAPAASNDGGRSSDVNINESGNRITCLIDLKDLNLGRKLGDGFFGEILEAEWLTPNGRHLQVAVKVLKEERMMERRALSEFLKEVESMQHLYHTNLISLHGVVLSPLLIVTELAPLGNLQDFLRKQCRQISILEIWNWAMQVLSGMEYLHSQRYIHRELSSRTILLVSKSTIKLGEFKLMVPLPPNEHYWIMPNGQKITWPLTAPECLTSKKFSYASDIWMFGVILWELFTFGEIPWKGLTGTQIAQKIIEGKCLIQPEACPCEVYGFIRKCWCAHPEKRPAVQEIFRCVLMTSLRFIRTNAKLRKGTKISPSCVSKFLHIDRKIPLQPFRTSPNSRENSQRQRCWLPDADLKKFSSAVQKQFNKSKQIGQQFDSNLQLAPDRGSPSRLLENSVPTVSEAFCSDEILIDINASNENIAHHHEVFAPAKPKLPKEKSESEDQGLSFFKSQLPMDQPPRILPPLPTAPPPALTRKSSRKVIEKPVTTYLCRSLPSTPPYDLLRGVSSQSNFSETVATLSELVPGAPADYVWKALNYTDGNVSDAEKLLKIEQLVKLGLGSQSKCKNILTLTNWNLEAAASALLGSS
ncbi:unnamed protein product [Allacma fusca]|uniref:non-specific protein-tyrosine kinase n=1 Tax=Allacma fusca TaxID=39272 RepID=A0A8J2P9Y4_9HEXA|nr:unnamed protein product [Allacma fusca]